MSKITYGIIISLLILVSCKKSTTSSELETGSALKTPWYINLEDIAQMEGVEALSTDASDIRYIPLETTSESLLTRINKVVFWNEHYLVSDLHTLYMFDKSGKFIRKISQKGNGPADYRYVNNTIVDPSSDILYLFTLNKIIKFDSEGNYIGNTPLKDICDRVPAIYSQGVLTSENTFLVYLANTVRLLTDTIPVYSLIEIDTSGVVINYYKNTVPRYAELLRGAISLGKRPLYYYEKNCRFLEFGSDTLYTIQADSMVPYAILDLGNMKMDHNPELFRATSAAKMEDEIKKLDEKLYINDIMESDCYLYILLQYGFNGDFLHCVYNKESGELKKLKENGFANDLDGGVTFFPKKIDENGTMISWKTAEEFKEDMLSKDYNSQKAKYGERFEKAYQLATSLNEDDNPILLFAKNR